MGKVKGLESGIIGYYELLNIKEDDIDLESMTVTV